MQDEGRRNGDARAAVAAGTPAEAEQPPAGVHRNPRSTELRLLEAADAGDWAGALRLARGLERGGAGVGALNVVVLAALMLRDPVEVAFATRLTIQSRVPTRLLATLAWRVARAGFTMDALAMMLSTPAAFGPPETMDAAQRLMVGRVLALLAADASVPPTLQRAAREHARRFPGPEPIDPKPSTRRFAPPGARLPLAGPRPRPHLAPGTPAPFLEEAERCLDIFERSAAKAPQAQVLEYGSVYVNDSGRLWRESTHFTPSHFEDLPQASLDAMPGAPRLAEGVLAINHNQNFYHWMAEWLPALAWRLDDASSTIPLLTSEAAPGFVRQSLDLAGNGPLPEVRPGPALLVDRLYTATRSAVSLVHGAAYAGLFDRVACRARATVVARPRAVYISRRDSPLRRMDNEEELIAGIAALGFEPLTLSGMSLAAQISTLQDARVVVAPHGAGLVHLLYMPPGARVFEIMPVLPGAMDIRMCFARLSWLRGHEHHVWLENANPVSGRWSSNTPAILRWLRDLMP